MAGFRDVFAVREFRALWLGSLLSRGGDQLTRVALAVLVFQRTGSAALTGLIFAMTLVPGVLGGPLLGWLADRYPRRDVMVVCDVVRVGLIGTLAFPQIPLQLVFVLVFVSQLLDSPARAARIAVIPDVLPAETYPTGVAVNQMTSQLITLAGFGVGGILVGVAGPSVSLGVDAATFAAAALITRLRVRPHAPQRADSDERPVRASFASTIGGFRLIASTPTLRCLLLLALLGFFHVIPEAIAVPYADSLGHGEAEAGFLMAVVAGGNVLGVFLLTRFTTADQRLRLLGPMAILSCVPLAASVFHPGLAALLVLWTLGGLLTGYQVTANVEFVRIAPAGQRGQAVGLASSALAGVAGLGVLAGGLVVQIAGPADGLAISSAAGIFTAIGFARLWHRARRTIPRSDRAIAG